MEENKPTIVFENDQPVIDKGICLDIICADKEPETKYDKYNYHLALNFFKNNFLQFSEKEITEVCSHPYAVKRLGGNFDITALQLCVKKGEAFPVALPSWAGKKIKKTLLLNYLEIINQKGDIEQLKFFSENFHDVMMDFIGSKTNISPILYESIARRILEPKNQENLVPILDILINKDVSILKYLEKNNTKEFRELLTIDINDINNKNANINVAQYLLLNKEYKSLHDIHEIFSSYKDILLSPVEVKICLYKKNTCFFEYALTQSKFIGFAPFTLNDDLDNEKKEQIVSAAFSLIQYKHEAFNHGSYYSTQIACFKEVLEQWYPSTINQATNEQIKNYSESALEGNENNSSLKKEIDSIILVRELNTDLSENSNKSHKKLKI